MISLETLLLLSGSAVVPYVVVATWDWLAERRQPQGGLDAPE